MIAMSSCLSRWTSSLGVFLQVNLLFHFYKIIEGTFVINVLFSDVISSKRIIIIWKRGETNHWIIGWEWRIYSYLWGQWRRQDACRRCPMAVRIFCNNNYLIITLVNNKLKNLCLVKRKFLTFVLLWQYVCIFGEEAACDQNLWDFFSTDM